MSSSNIDKRLSEAVDVGKKVVGEATGLWSKLVPIATTALKVVKGASSPAFAGWQGLLLTGRFLAYTTLGRIIVVLVMLLGTFTYFKHHFTKVERAAWEQVVAKKQATIIDKVESVEAKTAEAQRVARAKQTGIDSILGLVIGGIWKTEKQDPVEGETIDLINETRGKR